MRSTARALADGIDADWVDLSWGDATRRRHGAAGDRRQERARRARRRWRASSARNGANIVNLLLVHRDASFHTFHLAVEVRDLQHLMRILAALRAADAVSSAERL